MTTSRRAFLQTGAGLAVAGLARAESPLLAYAGGYTSQEGPEGSVGRGAGIFLFEMNPTTGALTRKDLFPNDLNPSWLALSPSKSYLYAANETSKFEGADSGSASAFSVDRGTGGLTLLNTVSSEGAGPAHLSVHPSGKWVFVANYGGGTVSVLPVLEDGKLGKATDIKRDEGTIGPQRAASAPEGSFAISGHDRPHAHMILPDPAGRFVLAADLGLDCIFVWPFDANTGKLGEADKVALPPGDGPRHFIFHPNGRWLYSLQEEGSTIVAFDYASATGKLTSRQTISSLPKNFRGSNFTSEIAVSPDARFVYAANRLHDTIAWFPIAKDGSLNFGGEEWTRGDYPRSFTIDPSGRFLYSCNQRGDAITTFRVNKKTGSLQFAGQYTPVGTPAILLFLK